MSYVIQNWEDAGKPTPTPIYSDTVDAGAGPSLEHMETGIYNAAVTADAAVPKPSTPSTSDVIIYNGSTYVSGKVAAANVQDGSLTPVKLASGVSGQVITTTGTGVAWGAGIPLRAVLMFHMDAGTEIVPYGWAVCDGSVLTIGNHDLGGGSYTLPDLRNRFILGADKTKAVGDSGTTSDLASAAPGPKGLGGIHSKTLITAELPSHTHTHSLSIGSHSHTATVTDPGHTHSYFNQTFVSGSFDSIQMNTSVARTTSFTGSNTTGISVTIGSVTGGALTGSINSTGSGTAFDTRPRFYGMVFIMKVRS